ncbi:MAG: hypothetical protein MUE81_10080 [Thermoflexibacter sp.]|jgi:hypothetical protein|nr:hypothetical protein [Thermoflexibacter sp.]
MKQKNTISKTFEKWKIGELHHTFGLQRHNEGFEPLDSWLASKSTFDSIEEKTLRKLAKELSINAILWNEDELKFMFISQLIAVADLQTAHAKIFTQRHISAEVNGIKLNGIVDFVIADGIDEPEQPFFFLHEYKQEKKSANDPLAQLLAEMLVAQAHNGNEEPLYGCYVMGRFWFFIVLQGDEYAVSNAFNASDEDVFQIVSILKAVRIKIEKWAGKEK